MPHKRAAGIGRGIQTDLVIVRGLPSRKSRAKLSNSFVLCACEPARVVPVEAGQCGRYARARRLRDVDEYEAVDCVDYHVCGECVAEVPVTVIGSAAKRTL